jgi:hypothetical protein
VYKSTKHDIGDFSQLTPVEQLRYMSSLTWDDVERTRGEHVTVLLNGTIASTNQTGTFPDLKLTTAEYSAMCVDYMFTQDIDMASNTSISILAIVSNTSDTASRVRLDLSSATTPLNSSAGDEVQFGYQDINNHPLQHTQPRDGIHLRQHRKRQQHARNLKLVHWLGHWER